MVMAGYTKGPWEFDPPHDNGTYEGAFYSGDEKVCSFGDSETYYPTEGEPPNTANAHLIAAAPDMYEALKEVAERHTLSEHNGELDWLIDDARAAIAKAEGGK